MSSALRAPEAPIATAPRRTRHEAARPSICFVGFSNLAVLAPEVDPSGASGEPVQHTLLATALARRGHRVSMVVADHGQPDGAIWDGVQTFKAFARGAGLPVLRFVHPRWTGLVSALSRADADVYYASCAGGLVGQVAMFCARHGKRFVFRTASDADCMPDALISLGRWYRRDKWLYAYGLRRAAERARADRATAGAHASQLRYRELDRRSRRPAGPQRARVRRARHRCAVGEQHALGEATGRVAERRGPAAALSFHMVGGTVPGARRFFETSRRKRRVAATSPSTAPSRIATSGAFYSRARVLVNTSDIEGFPNTYLQAWASGTPVVAFFDPDGVIAREGLGATVRTADEMCEAVRRLTSDESAWKRHGNAASPSSNGTTAKTWCCSRTCEPSVGNKKGRRCRHRRPVQGFDQNRLAVG